MSLERRLFFLNKMLRHEPTQMRDKSPKSLAPPEHCEDDSGIEQLRNTIERFRQHEGGIMSMSLWESSHVTSGSSNIGLFAICHRRVNIDGRYASAACRETHSLFRPTMRIAVKMPTT